MKTNQIFNFARFGKYVRSTFSTTYKQNLLLWGALTAFIFVSSLLSMADNTSRWNTDGWMPLFIGTYFVAGIVFASYSFPQFRNKEKTMMSLMTPVTSFERLLYEILGKVVVFIILFPALFYLLSSFAVVVRNVFQSNQVVTVNGVNSFPFHSISFDHLITGADGFFWAFFGLSIAVFSLSFAGAAVFRKYPLVKTIVFVGGVLAVTAGYFVLIFEKFHLINPWISNVADQVSKEQGIAILIALAATMSLITLAYAYFKLKEKEVQ